MTPGKDKVKNPEDRTTMGTEIEERTPRDQDITVTGMMRRMTDQVDPLVQVEPLDPINMTKNQNQVTDLETTDSMTEAIAGIEPTVTEVRVEKEPEVMELLETGRTTMGGGPEVLAGRPNVLGGLLQAPP